MLCTICQSNDSDSLALLSLTCACPAHFACAAERISQGIKNCPGCGAVISSAKTSQATATFRYLGLVWAVAAQPSDILRAFDLDPAKAFIVHAGTSVALKDFDFASCHGGTPLLLATRRQDQVVHAERAMALANLRASLEGVVVWTWQTLVTILRTAVAFFRSLVPW